MFRFWPTFDLFLDYRHNYSQDVSYAQILGWHSASVSESCIDVEEIDGNNDDDEYGANSQDCCAQRLISREIPIQDNRPCGRPSVAECDDDDHKNDDDDDAIPMTIMVLPMMMLWHLQKEISLVCQVKYHKISSK